jgi:putative SOS response-associated peptidase YedK
MCFSVNVNLVKEELENRYGATFLDPGKYSPSYYYHAFGLPEMAAICSGQTGNVQLLKWGLIPSWVKSRQDADEIRFKTFNARAESISDKPSFSASFSSKRCIIPVKGFFEWQHAGAKRIPWYIFRADDDIISFAGLWDEWVQNTTGEKFSTFTIVTTDANELMAGIHNSAKRMPVILDKPDEMKWLDLDNNKTKALELLKPCPSGILRAHTISDLVNKKSSDRNTPEVIRPFERDIEGALF